MDQFKKAALLSFASAAALSFACGSATAQEEESDAVARLGTVTVTAQKREESLQDVPIAITAVSAETLAASGIEGTRELTLITPGLNFVNNVSSGSPVIRGVATRGIGPGDEPSSPIYIDGVYMSSTHSGFFEFNNIQQIEVLKGPQGTLFGRNALGGAINITTLKPTYELSGKADISYGTDNEVRTNAYISSGLLENVAFSIAAHADRRDGHIESLVEDEKQARSDSFNIRGKLLFEPAENFSVTLSAHHLESHDDTAYSGFPVDGNTSQALVPGQIIAGPGQTATTDPTFFRMNQQGASLVADWELQAFDVSFLQSYLATSSFLRTDSDAAPLGSRAFAEFSTTDEAYSTELRFTSNGDGPVDWIGGLYYFNSEGCYGCNERFSAFPVFQIKSEIGTEAYAVFGEVGFQATENLKFIAGARASTEERTKDYFRANYVAGVPAATLPFIAADSVSFDDTSFRASAIYDIAPNYTAFATFSQGFKSGFFNASTGPNAAGGFDAVEPEELDNFEIGLKTEPAENLRFNVSAYSMKYENLQVSSRSPFAGSTTIVENAASAENTGLEAELEWAVTTDWNIAAGLSLQEARFKEFPSASGFIPRTNLDATIAIPPGLCVDPVAINPAAIRLGGNRSVSCDSSGLALENTPDWAFNIRSDYSFPAFGGDVNLAGILFVQDEYFYDNIGYYKSDGQTRLNLTATWRNQADNRFVQIYGKNVTEDDHPIQQFIGAASTYRIDNRGAVLGIRLGASLN